jgi:hypothetical protein
LETVVTTHPTRYISDSEGLKLGEITVNRNYEQGSDYVDKAQYEGVYTDKTSPGYHAVLRRGSNGQNQPEVEAIKIPTLEVRERTLVCEYEILTNDITDKMAESLIVTVLLGDYYEHDYQDEADEIEFINIKSHTHRTISYSSVI